MIGSAFLVALRTQAQGRIMFNALIELPERKIELDQAVLTFSKIEKLCLLSKKELTLLALHLQLQEESPLIKKETFGLPSIILERFG